MQKILSHIQESNSLTLANVGHVGGGSIHQASRLIDSKTGTHYFLKSNSLDGDPMFDAETRGLDVLRGAAARQGAGLIVPKTVARGTTDSSAWLLMEFLNEGRPSPNDWVEMGRVLALLHQDMGDSTAIRSDSLPGPNDTLSPRDSTASGSTKLQSNTTRQKSSSPENSALYGLNHDNFIGSLPQYNTSVSASWSEFFINSRLEPQFNLAQHQGKLNPKKAKDVLYKWIEKHFPDGPPSIVHGDFWSGNVMFVQTDEGLKPAIFDPAIYIGHAEVDLAMTHLFGGFPSEFYAGYREITPISDGFSDRKIVLNLYFILVHVNLFGGGYIKQAEAILRRFERA
jgi:fructosamine-3-kinase